MDCWIAAGTVGVEAAAAGAVDVSVLGGAFGVSVTGLERSQALRPS